MSFRFVHTADWQIGKPFRSFGERVAGKLEEARLDAIERLAKVASEAGASHVLVAGDVYDAEGLPQKTLLQPLHRMAAHPTIRWLLLPGNHDPHRPRGLWQKIAAAGLPANVTACLKPEPIELAPAVTLFPAPLTTKGLAADPTDWMDGAATPAGTMRIGLAHGSIKDFGEDGESSNRIAADRAAKAGLAYLALGDWHGLTRVNDRTWYSGTPEPDRFADNEPGFALIVSLDGATAPPRVERVATGHYRWASRTAEVTSVADLDAMDRDIAALLPQQSRLLVQLRLTGTLPLEALAGLDERLVQLDARLAYLDADRSALHVSAATGGDLDALGTSGELRWAAEKLQAMAADPAEPRRVDAENALVRLLQLAREVAKDKEAA